MTVEGVDYSFDPPDPAGLVAAGKKFVVRYGGLGKPGKFLTAAEVTRLKAAGLAIVANVEETKGGLRGAAAGRRWAQAGDAFFQKLGMPAHRPIYLSVDWDAGPADWPDVDAALRGAASVIGSDRVGVYGGYDTVAHCAEVGSAAWFWQTYAWSAGRWHSACHVQQYQNNIGLAGGTVDLDRAVAVDYGQWGGGTDVAQSPEYPDLKWVPSKSWTNANRSSVQLIVIHTTEGSEGRTSAEDGAAYDQRRTDGTSTHYFHDADSTVQCVRTEDIAHAARHEGNLRGIQHELCGKAGQSAAQWADASSDGTLRRAARQCARDAQKWGIPVRHVTVAQVAAGVKGFCAHYDITRAFPQDGGTHTDPGDNFRWTDFLTMVRDEMEGEDMTFEADQVPVKYPPEWAAGSNNVWTGPNALGMARDLAHETRDLVKSLTASLTASQKALLAAVQAVAAKDSVDEQALAEVLAPAVAAVLVANLPQGGDPISADEVNAAVLTAFRKAFSQPQ